MKEYHEKRFGLKIEDGIVYAFFYEPHIDYELVNDGIIKRLELTQGESYPMLSDLRNIKSGSREARERMAAKDAGKGISAAAILVNSKVQRTIYGFFHSIYKAPAPAKLFTNKEKAIEWLQQFKKTNL